MEGQAIKDELQADELLSQAGAFVDGSGIYREADLIKEHYAHVSTMPPDAMADVECPQRTVGLDMLTKRQQQAVKLTVKLGNRVAAAKRMGVCKAAMTQILQRAEQRIVDALARIEEERPEVSGFGQWLWREEQKTKYRQIYRRNVHPMKVRNYVRNVNF